MHQTLSRLREKRDNGDEGFTLIELLVVVVIIGVLVAIAVPVYLNYREGAADKSAQSDVRGAISAIEQYYTDMNNTYPTGPVTTAQIATFSLVPASTAGGGKITLSAKTQFGYVPVGTPPTSYKICAKSTGGSGKTYLYDSTVGGSVAATATALGTIGTCS
jgi:type IV pilus assembly protein PilA